MLWAGWGQDLGRKKDHERVSGSLKPQAWATGRLCGRVADAGRPGVPLQNGLESGWEVRTMNLRLIGVGVECWILPALPTANLHLGLNITGGRSLLQQKYFSSERREEQKSAPWRWRVRSGPHCACGSFVCFPVMRM